MWSFLEFIWDFVCLQWFFGNTGRLVVKTITFGQVDLDLDRWGQSFIAVVVGIAFWVAVVIGYIWWQHPQFLNILNAN